MQRITTSLQPLALAQGHRLGLLSPLAVAVLVACGGGGGGGEPVVETPAPVAFSGVVADGPLKDATVCYDLNDNGACDSGEPSSTTDADGKYKFDVAVADAGKHGVVAVVPATAIDKDTGAAVGAAFTLKAPATSTAGAQDVFVSPLTTAVADIVKDSGKTVAEAAEQVKSTLQLSGSPLANFTAAGGDANAALAARSLGAVVIETTKLAVAAGVSAAEAAALIKTATTTQLNLVASTLASSTATTPAAKAAEVLVAVKAELNLESGTVKAVAEQLAKPAGTADAPGPFVSLRRFAYTDANNYSYTVFVGDSSKTDTNGEFVASEVRKTVSAGADAPFNRNQVYWTGTEWKTCALQWEVSTRNKAASSNTPQTSSYCDGAKFSSKVSSEDISGKTLREVVTKIRSSPLADSVGAHTDPVTGLPVNWGPAPELLPADAKFPDGSKLSTRFQQADLGGTDRIELTTKSTVRWADNLFRQATTLEQYGSMRGNMADAAVVPVGNNTVFVTDLALAAQADATLEKTKRYRAAFDIPGLNARFYTCDLRKSDQASINCATVGDGKLAISTQGGVRLLKFASGYPAELTARNGQQRFWAEYGGTVFRGMRDLERTRADMRLNGTAWDALRTALGIPAHTAPVAPVASGPFRTLRSFNYTDASNYSWRQFEGDSSVLDADSYFVANERRRTVSAGVAQTYSRNRLYWTGTEWYDCPSNGDGVNLINSKAPQNSIFCKSYKDDRAANITMTLGGRSMSDVINDIRTYGSTDFGDGYGDWGPSPSANPALASSRFPEGSTLEYRGNIRKETPIAIATVAGSDQVRVAPSATSTAAFATWPFAATLEQMVAGYPGSLIGTTLNGNTALFVNSFTEAPTDAAYTDRVQIRVAFDANGNKARFTRNNLRVSNGSTANYQTLLDTTYTVETLGGVRVMRFAAMPAGFESNYFFQRMFAERNGSVWYAFKDVVPASGTQWSIRLNGTAFDAMRTTLGIQ